MTITETIKYALAEYVSGNVHNAAKLLREVSSKIEQEADAYDAYKFDADGLTDHQRARAEP